MQSYKRLRLQRFAKTSQDTSENRHWYKYKPLVSKQETSVGHVSFSPCAPYPVAVCCSTRVLIFDASTARQTKQITRFKSPTCCATYRNDGKLVVAGSSSGFLSVHDVSSRVILRTYREHTGAVRQARFSHSEMTKICSTSDDKTVRYFDLPSGTQVQHLGDHDDYVRALTQHPTDNATWISGSYDNVVKCWDTRANLREPTRRFDHGHAVEAVLAMPKGTLVLSAGDNVIKVWDMLSGRLVTQFSNHQKVITSLACSNNGTRIISGSADNMVKIYDSTSFQVTHSFTYQSPVLSVDISADNSSICAGLSDGTVSIRKRPQQKAVANNVPRNIRTGTRRFFERGHRAEAGPQDYKAELLKKQTLKTYDRYLKKFQYHHALDAALKSQRAVVVASVIDELVIRGGLQIALSGRDEESLEHFLQFLVKNINNPHFSTLLTEVAGTTLDLYSGMIGQSMRIDELLVQLNTRLRTEAKLQSEMFSLMGALDVVVYSASRRSSPLSLPAPSSTSTATPASTATPPANGSVNSSNQQADSSTAKESSTRKEKSGKSTSKKDKKRKRKQQS